VRRLILALAAVALGACSTPGSPSPSSSVSVPLLGGAGAGFTQKLDVGLDLDHAAAATPAATGPTRPQLRGQGYSGGEERVWTKGDEYVTLLEFELSTQVGAAAFVSFEAQQLSGALGATVYPDPQIPGAQAFDLAGQTRVGKRQTFCQGVWFPAGTAVFEVADCASSPRYPELTFSLALKQYKAAQ
jgi:hypothetical protein